MPGRHGVERVRPAAVGRVVAEADAGVRRQRGDAGAQAGVAVGVDPVAGGGAVGVDAGRAAPERHRRVDLADVGGVDLDQREVVVGAGVRRRWCRAAAWSASCCRPACRAPTVVPSEARLPSLVKSTLVPSGSDVGVAAVGVGRRARCRRSARRTRRRRCRRRRCRRSSRCTGRRRCTSSCRGGSARWRPAPTSARPAPGAAVAAQAARRRATAVAERGAAADREDVRMGRPSRGDGVVGPTT